MSRISKYQKSLESLPPTGRGLHPALLGAANYAVMAGVDGQKFLDDIREYVDESNRKVPDQEILSAYETAARDLVPTRDLPSDHKPVKRKNNNVEPAVLDLQSLPTCSEEEIKTRSPELIPEDPKEQTNAFLNYIYSSGEMLFIGENNHAAVLGRNLMPKYEWEKKKKFSPLIIPNPLSGEKGLSKAGKPSYRSQDCVKDFKYLVIECDETPLEDQLPIVNFLIEKGPVTSVTFSGGKSYHSLLKIDARDKKSFDSIVNHLRPYLLGIGADKACWHPDRLTRLPGVCRPDKGNEVQRLIYLNSNPENRVKNLLMAFEDLAGENKPQVILPGGSQTISATGKKLGELLAKTGKYYMRGGLVVEVS